MKLFACLGLILGALAQTTMANSPTDDQGRYDQALSQLNKELAQAHRQRSCPGLKLVLTCGNKTCDENEDASNCPADCVKAAVHSYNYQTLCTEYKTIYRPRTLEEARDAVKAALNANLKIRIVGASHSANDQICGQGIVISTEFLKEIHGLETFKGEEVVNVQAGVTQGELNEWLYQNDKSIGITPIGYRGVTIGGSTATGSHGSSSMHDSVLSGRIRSMTLITANGKIRTYHADNTSRDQWKALKASLGMLGFVVSLRLAVEDHYNLHVKVSYHKEKKLLREGGLLKQVENCDFGQMNWFPGSGKFLKVCGKKTQKKAHNGATNTLLQPDIPDLFVKPFKAVLQYSACHNWINCLLDKVRYWQYKIAPYFKKLNKKGKLKSSHNLIGPSHRMVSSAFTPKADGFFQMDWEIAVPGKNLDAAIKDVYKHIEKNKICLPLVGVFIRFTKAADETLLAHSGVGGEFDNGEPVAFIEMPVYLPSGFGPDRQAEYDKVFEDFARLLIEKHGGRAHWAKNRNWVFEKHVQMGTYRKKLQKFQNIVNQMDPTGIFSNSYARTIGLKYK